MEKTIELIKQGAMLHENYVAGRAAFKGVWQGIYGGTKYDWNANPWVWRVEFKLLKDDPQ